MPHTPEPWFYDRRTESIGYAGGWIAGLDGREGEGLGCQRDDGMLMAAAPLLLRACKLWCELEQHEEDCPDCALYPCIPYRKLRRKAEAARKKALKAAEPTGAACANTARTD